jgi:hypothetical protein
LAVRAAAFAGVVRSLPALAFSVLFAEVWGMVRAECSDPQRVPCLSA